MMKGIAPAGGQDGAEGMPAPRSILNTSVYLDTLALPVSSSLFC
jgi:hypothetical protein